MRIRIQKWGESLALRIPQAFASEAQLTQDALVDVSVVDGKLVVTPIVEPAFTLEGLLAGITEENLHGELDMGVAMGNEVW